MTKNRAFAAFVGEWAVVDEFVGRVASPTAGWRENFEGSWLGRRERLLAAAWPRPCSAFRATSLRSGKTDSSGTSIDLQSPR